MIQSKNYFQHFLHVRYTGGPAQIAGVQQALVKNKDDGTFCLNELRSRIRINPDVHEPYTSLIVIENTHNMCGGKVNLQNNELVPLKTQIIV